MANSRKRLAIMGKKVAKKKATPKKKAVKKDK